MNKLTKIGITALCGSLAATFSAHAGDLSVTGGADMTWIGLAVGMGVIMVIWRLKRPPDEKMDPPGNFTMFFSPVQGEGDIFIGGILVIYFMSRFFLESFQNIRATFG